MSKMVYGPVVKGLTHVANLVKDVIDFADEGWRVQFRSDGYQTWVDWEPANGWSPDNEFRIAKPAPYREYHIHVDADGEVVSCMSYTCKVPHCPVQGNHRVLVFAHPDCT